MDIKGMYESKLISMEEALDKFKSGDKVVSSLGVSEPKALLSNLHRLHNKVHGITITTLLPIASCEYFTNPIYKDTIQMNSVFFTGAVRNYVSTGNVSYTPSHLQAYYRNVRSYEKQNVFISACSPVDKHGYVSLGASAVYEKEFLNDVDLVILEVNPNVPRTFGDTVVHIDDVNYFIESNELLPTLPIVQPTLEETKIGQYIAEYIDDRATIQLGIGGVPNAVAQSLMGKKDLGIHTEMLTDGLVDLIQAGVVTNKYKTLHHGKTVTSFAYGSQRLYDFLDDNPSVLFYSASHVNSPYVIAQNDNMISVNTSLEVDLMGQVCSESIGRRQFSGTGGQSDTAIGAQLAKNGKSFIALNSTALVKDKATGERIPKSKIVLTLQPGAAVTLSRNDVDYVVTEYGVAHLKGAPLRERAKRLIAIAHPQFREELMFEAKDVMFV
ncbi:MAG: acetyl-CoA hydrolase/transferase family protein [Bacillaceae bacterium]